MFKFSFILVLGFSCLFLCEGAVFPPSNKTNVTFIPGSTEKLVWSFTDDIINSSLRTWIFTPSNRRPLVTIALVVGDGELQTLSPSFGVAAEKPATLVFKNVKLSYDGTYKFSLLPGGSAEVVVYVAVKPNATPCSSPITVKEGDNVSCTCEGRDGNPPADVTWYKDNRKIGGTGRKEKTLTLTNVTNEKDHGSYKCVAQSYPNETFQDEVMVEVIVNSKPKTTKIEMPEEAYIAEKLVISCSSKGFPAPNFTITHNVTTNIVSNQSRYIKHTVDYSDAGLYKCIAKNSFGNNTDSDYLIVKEKRPSTKPAPKKTTPQSTKSTQSSPSKPSVPTTADVVRGLSNGAIAGICVAVLLLVVNVTIVVYCCHKKKEKEERNCGNIDPIAGNHYELDNEEAVGGDNSYDTVPPVASGSKSNAPVKDNLPPVYAAVDTNNRQGNTLYASLDTDAMKPKRESKKEPANRAPQTEYASIDFAKTANAPKADPV